MISRLISLVRICSTIVCVAAVTSAYEAVFAQEPLIISGSTPAGWIRFDAQEDRSMLIGIPLSDFTIAGASSLIVWDEGLQRYVTYKEKDHAWVSGEVEAPLRLASGLVIGVSGTNAIYFSGRVLMDGEVDKVFPAGLATFGAPFPNTFPVPIFPPEGALFVSDTNGGPVSEFVPSVGYWVQNVNKEVVSLAFKRPFVAPFSLLDSLVLAVDGGVEPLISIKNMGGEALTVDVLAHAYQKGFGVNWTSMWEVIEEGVAIPATGSWEGPDRRVDIGSDGRVYTAIVLGQDQDQDGLDDAREVLVWGANPSNPDSDGDGLLDGVEVLHGTNPIQNDSAGDADGDGVDNAAELARGTDAFDARSRNVVWYVDSIKGRDTNSGLQREATPLRSMNVALAKALPDDAIHVADGAYTENIDDSGRGVTWEFGNISVISSAEEVRHEAR